MTSATTTAPQDRARQLAGLVSVSTISLADQLGIHGFELETEDGELRTLGRRGTGPMTLNRFPEAVVERTGLTSIEICQVQVPSVTALEALPEALAAAGASVLALAVDIGNIASPVPARRADALTRIRAWFPIAVRLGIPFVRTSTGAPRGASNHDPEGLVEALADLADDARGYGLHLLIENSGSVDDCLDLLERVGPERLGLVLDTGNIEPMLAANTARLLGEPLDETLLDFEPVYEGIRRMVPFASIVHAKVHDIRSDGSFAPIDVERALRIVHAGGFAGPITLECEGRSSGDGRWADVTAATRLVESIFGAGDGTADGSRRKGLPAW